MDLFINNGRARENGRDLSGIITDASLFAHLASYNFGGDSYCFGSLWGSTDGTSWQLLMDAPTPSGIAEGYFYKSEPPILVTRRQRHLNSFANAVVWCEHFFAVQLHGRKRPDRDFPARGHSRSRASKGRGPSHERYQPGIPH
jgi:hypothetical protein